MGIETMRGIILKELPKGETSKQLIVLVKGVGKVWMTAKGARKTKSPLLAGTQLFCYCDFMVYESRGFYTIQQIELIESFFDLRMDLDRLASAMYLADLAEQFSQRGLEQDSTMALLLQTFQILCKKEYMPALVTRIFELKLIQLAGVMPDLEGFCCMCEKKAEEYFSSLAGGMVCRTHNSGARRLSAGARQAMRYVFQQKGKRIFQFSVSKEVLQELGDITEEYIQVHLHLRVSSRNFSKKI